MSGDKRFLQEIRDLALWYNKELRGSTKKCSPIGAVACAMIRRKIDRNMPLAMRTLRMWEKLTDDGSESVRKAIDIKLADLRKKLADAENAYVPKEITLDDFLRICEHLNGKEREGEHALCEETT